jgi:transcriptional regulator with XRE-family HTH domain
MRIANLAEFKEKKGLSGREMARQLDISESYLSEILSGQRSLSKKLAKRISEITGIPVLNLLYPQGVSHDTRASDCL